MEFAICGVAPLIAVTPLQAEAEAGCFVVMWARTNMKRWTSLLKVIWREILLYCLLITTSDGPHRQ